MRRPIDFHGFYGQREITQFLVQLDRGAKHRGQPCQHKLFAGGSGLGKTHLAKVLAEDYGTTLHYVLASKEFGVVELGTLAAKLDTADHLFLDEAHALPFRTQEALYQIIDENRAPTIVEDEKKRLRVEGVVEIPPVTIIVATDRAGRLRRALLKRLPVRVELRPYIELEMAFIVRHRASEFGMLLSREVPAFIAKSCEGVPRIAGQLLKNLRDYYAKEEADIYTKPMVRAFLRAQGLDCCFRSPMRQTYMAMLADSEPQGTSLGTLALALELEEEYVKREIEPWLFRQHWVSKSHGGRRLTRSGLDVVHRARKGGGK